MEVSGWARGIVSHLLGTSKGAITTRCWTSRAIALVDFSVSVTQLDGDVSLQFILETYSLSRGKYTVRRYPIEPSSTCTPDSDFTTVLFP